MKNRRSMVISETDQVGTQFDGFAHQAHHDSRYNCVQRIDRGTGGDPLKLERARSP